MLWERSGIENIFSNVGIKKSGFAFCSSSLVELPLNTAMLFTPAFFAVNTSDTLSPTKKTYVLSIFPRFFAFFICEIAYNKIFGFGFTP